MAMDGGDTRTGHRRMSPVHPRKRCFNMVGGQMMMHVTAKRQFTCRRSIDADGSIC